MGMSEKSWGLLWGIDHQRYAEPKFNRDPRAELTA